MEPKRTFTGITGETTDQFPADPTIDSANPINDPHILDFVQLRDRDGNVIDPTTPAAQEQAVTGDRRTTLAARLRAVCGSVNKIDAFVGMVSERHVRGNEFGALQLAIWTTQFAALRDGDRFFYANDGALTAIKRAYGVSFRHTLAEIIGMNSDAQVPADVFKVVPSPAAPPPVASPSPALVAPAVPKPADATTTVTPAPDSTSTTSVPPASTTVAPESPPVTTSPATSGPVTVPVSPTSVPDSTTSPPVLPTSMTAPP